MANKKLDTLVLSTTQTKDEIVQAAITTLNSRENNNPDNKYITQVIHVHKDGENAGKQYFVISDTLKTEKGLNSNVLDINVGLNVEQVQALIAQAQLNGANIDQEALKNLIAQELAKNPTTGITEQRVQELITQSTITEQRVQELITQSSITIDDTTANATKVFSSQKVEQLLTPKLEENQVKALITKEMQKLPQDSINEEQVRNLITEELAKSPADITEQKVQELISQSISSKVSEAEVNELIDKKLLDSNNSKFAGQGAPQTIDNVVAGDTYTDTTTQEIYIFKEGAWQKVDTKSPTYTQAGFPSTNVSSANVGETYKNSDTGITYVYTGTTWKELQTNTIAKDIQAASNIKVVNVESDGVIDISKGDYFRLTMSQAVTLSLKNEPSVTDKPIYCFILEILNASNYSLTWFSGVSWSKNTIPTFSGNTRQLFSFIVTENNIVGISLAKELTNPSRIRG